MEKIIRSHGGKPAIGHYFVDGVTHDELKHVVHLGKVYGVDTHLLKIVKRFPNGDRYSEIQILKNFLRPWWLEAKQTGTRLDAGGNKISVRRDKSEYISENLVSRRMCTESDLYHEANNEIEQKVYGGADYKKRRAVMLDPYVYGVSIPGTAFITDWYNRNGKSSRWKCCMFDIEVNIENPSNEYVTHISMATPEEAFLGVMRERFTRHGPISDYDIIEGIKESYYEEIDDGERIWHSKPREVKLFDCQFDLIEYAFALTHQWDIDFLAIWNMGYDIKKIESIYENQFRTTKMKYLLKDPSLPDDYARYEYKEGRDKIVTKLDNGKEKITTFKLHEIWDDVTCSAGYKIIDAMKSFYQLRSQTPDIEGGFSLANVLVKVAKTKKLHNPETDGLTKAEGHVFLSNNRPYYYAAYSMNDSDAMLVLDDTTKDLQLTVPNALGAAPFANMNSLPQRLHVAIAFDMLSNGVIVGTNGIREPDPILGIGDGWIVTLPAYRMDTVALPCISESKDIPTTHYGHVFDADEVSAYPYATTAANVGKETTRCELTSMNGEGKSLFLEQNINLIMNRSNAPMYVKNLFNIGSFGEMLNHIENGTTRKKPKNVERLPEEHGVSVAVDREMATGLPKGLKKPQVIKRVVNKKVSKKLASLHERDMDLFDSL